MRFNILCANGGLLSAPINGARRHYFLGTIGHLSFCALANRQNGLNKSNILDTLTLHARLFYAYRYDLHGDS